MNPLELTNSDLARSKNHISNVSNNILNLSETRSSALSIRYISYFYHVFPLHLNSFNRLFSDVISPKLSILISSINTFTCLTSEIETFICSLKPVSSYLDKNNPAESLLDTIQKFNAQNYVNGVKKHINEMITALESKLKYDQIIGQVKGTQSWIVSEFNKELKKLYEDFKNNIDGHKKTLEDNIKLYIGKIKEDLTNLCSCVEELSRSISTAIDNLETNQSKLKEFDKFITKVVFIILYSLFRNGHTGLCPEDMEKLKKIIDTHEKYKGLLTKSCPDVTTKLKELKGKLEEIKDCFETLKNQLNDLSSGVPDKDKIESVLNKFQSFKSTLEANFDDYVKCAKKLEEIGKHITAMKDAVNQLKDKVVKDAEKYINELVQININANQVEEDIQKIKGLNQLAIDRLKIAKHAIDFHKSLKEELHKLNQHSVTLQKYNFSEFYKNSRDIKDKLTSFETKIKEAIQKAGGEIEELKEQCPEIQERSSGQEDKLISCELDKLQKDYTQDIPEITSFIDKSLEDIKMIQHVLKVLEYNKKQSVIYINDIKCQVCKLNDLNNAKATLPKIKDCLDKVVKLQEDTKFWIDISSSYPKLSSLSPYSKPLEQIINDSKSLSGFINYYIGYLKIVEGVDSIITWIKCCYESKIQIIKQILGNFKAYVDVITSKLEAINSNLCELKCDIEKCCSGYSNNSGFGTYDLHKLKDYMNNLKLYWRKIKTDFTTIQVLLEKIKQESSYIDQNKCDLELIKSVIECYTNQNNDKKGPEKAVIDYLKPIKDRIKEILKIKHMIMNCLDMKKIKNIESKLSLVEQSIKELECAIEGVVRNMIRCSLKSLINDFKKSADVDRSGVNTTNHLIINYSILNVTNYNVIVNNSLEFWKMAEEGVRLMFITWFCSCVINFKSNYGSEAPSTFPESLYRIKTKDINPVSELSKNTMADNVGNHLCLCLVVKYHLRPAMLKCLLYLRNEDLGTLSTISRKHGIYNNFIFSNIDLWKLYCLTLIIIYKIVYWIKDKYKFVWVGFNYLREIKCFCTIKDTVEYHYLISIILYLSSLIENIWRSDRNSIGEANRCLSSLLSEYQSIHVYTNYYSLSKCRIYPLIVDKKCGQPATNKCCWCVACYNVLLAYIYLCFQCALCKALCKNSGSTCDKIKTFCTIEECNCTCQGNQNGLCCLLKLALSSQVCISTDLQELLKDCCESCAGQPNGCCKEICEKVKSGEADLLVIGCNCDCETQEVTQVKAQCVLFKNPWGGRSAAVVIVCKCEKQKCCCLKDVIEKLKGKEPLKELCENCQCQKLKNISDELCKDPSCCGSECPCKTLKTKFDEICNKGSGNCLCSKIEALGTLCKKECTCKKEVCCRCVCCKVLIAGVKVLTRACRQNFLEPYKRITLDLISSSTDKQVIRSIVNSINNRTLNITYLLKNNYSTHFNTYTDHKNIANSFPRLTMGYGYENVY